MIRVRSPITGVTRCSARLPWKTISVPASAGRRRRAGRTPVHGRGHRLVILRLVAADARHEFELAALLGLLDQQGHHEIIGVEMPAMLVAWREMGGDAAHQRIGAAIELGLAQHVANEIGHHVLGEEPAHQPLFRQDVLGHHMHGIGMAAAGGMILGRIRLAPPAIGAEQIVAAKAARRAGQLRLPGHGLHSGRQDEARQPHEAAFGQGTPRRSHQSGATLGVVEGIGGGIDELLEPRHASRAPSKCLMLPA